MFNGRRYRVYIWPLTITPISAGPQDINFQFTLAAQMPDQRNTRNSSFGSGMLDNLFGRSERFNIYTEPTQIEVLPLPTEGRPKSFSGAIGMFKLQVAADEVPDRRHHVLLHRDGAETTVYREYGMSEIENAVGHDPAIKPVVVFDKWGMLM